MSTINDPTVRPDTDPVADLEAAHALRDRTTDALFDARRHLAALPIPTGVDVDWPAHWTELASRESTVAEVYHRRAEDDPSDTEAAEQAGHYRDRASTSLSWAIDAQQWTQHGDLTVEDGGES